MESTVNSALLREAGVSLAEIGRHLGLVRSAITHKKKGRRPWKLEESRVVCALVSERLDRTVAVDELFPAGGVE